MVAQATARRQELARQLVALAVAFTFLGVGGLLWLDRYDPVVESVATIDPGCSQVPLTVHGEWTLIQHRNWFEAPVHIATSSHYLIVNALTHQGYRWSALTVPTGTRFEVRTRWALFHSAWADDPWLLVYNC